MCDRWIYTTCLCFALDLEEQNRSGFRYHYSTYQFEYSRNLIFASGYQMSQVMEGFVDRNRVRMDMKMLKTILGRKERPHRRKGRKLADWHVTVERPSYDLTIFKLHCGKLALKIYTKGERVLRTEAMALNVEALKCGRLIEKLSLGEGDSGQFLKHIRLLVVAGPILQLPGMVGPTTHSLCCRPNAGRRNRHQPSADAARDSCFVGAVRFTRWIHRIATRRSRHGTNRPNWILLRREASVIRPEETPWKGNGVSGQRKPGAIQASPEALRTLSAVALLQNKVIRPVLASGLAWKSHQPYHQKAAVHGITRFPIQ